MRILLIQSASEHSENFNYREAMCFKRAFDGLHVESEVWGKGHALFDTPFEVFSRSFDTLLVLENYGADWLPDVSRFKGRKLMWSIDSHKIAGEMRAYAERSGIDTMLVAWKNHLGLFEGLDPVWFPPCFSPDLIKPLPHVAKDYPVGFCGSRSNRGGWLDSLSRDVGLKQDIFVLGDKMVRAINSYRMHFNKNETPDVLAFRTFETLGCGTLLLTDRSGNVLEILQDGRNVVTYEGYDDCVDKVRYYLEHKEEADKIAALGYEEAVLKHTYRQRAVEIMALENRGSSIGLAAKDNEDT